MFDLPDSWVWDFWFADDGEHYHVFFLHASRALHDPERRHLRASIGHAVSDDLVSWRRVADALVRDDAPAFDDVATWTGSVVRHDDGTWYLYYTGVSFEGGRNVQRLGYATSADLSIWTKAADNPVLESDSRWYERAADSPWNEETWRDPWVMRDPGGAGWHILVTARAVRGDSDTRGVVGHAVSADLRTWEARPPLSEPVPEGFGQLEVMQVEEVDGRPVLIFSCLPPQASERRRAESPRGAIWAAPADSITGPFRIGEAYALTEQDLYVGRLLRRRDDGQWLLFAFRNFAADGAFVGGITDGMPIGWRGDRLVVERT
ncbi:beta-fructofuranosidase [Microbacterium sp. cf046]|uniref:glycosyl hydrolase family 32 n=1 Tax=Microbacterium sp. cf046 TaxID=1761803 RepID=UPI0008E6A603|nr:glycosyl hydrolase family 32 [Microbacterium sp. cf046]SFS15976.1 beta-fructofuranosidase [Microbacterium sp. cf046]